MVLRGGALGDFIVTLPALALLRQRWPDARIELIGNANAAELARSRGLLDAVHSQHAARWSALFGSEPLSRELADWLGSFDLVINYWPDPEGELRARFPMRTGQKFLSAAAMPERAPAAAHYCQPLREIGLEASELWFRIKPLESGRAHDAERAIAIHPGSGSPRKNWPLDRWADVCAWLKREHAAKLVIITGEAETNDTLAEFGALARNLPLEQLVAVLSSARLFLGHDSGVSHLAAACGAPSILLFGPTDPAMWAPPAPHITVLRRESELASISVADVQRAIRRAFQDQT